MDLKWQLSLLSMRARMYYQKNRKKITINRSDTAGYDKSKVECVIYTSSNVMVAIDGTGFDWSFMADEEVPTNLALMAFSDSEYDNLRIELNKSKFDLATYKRGLASVEEQLVFYKKNKVMFYRKLKKEKESNQIKIDNFENASKSLDKLIGSQITDKGRKGVGFESYNDVTPLPTGYGSKVFDSDEEEYEVMVSDNVQHKLEQANQPRKVSQNPRNNRTNWNEKKTQKLGVGFKFIKKACFVCGSFNHLIKDCDFHDKKMVQKPGVNNVQKGTAVLTMSGIVPISIARQSSSKAALVTTADFSRFYWVFFLATKDETSGILKTFITEIENLLDHKVKVSVARTSQQNGVAERKNKTLIEAVRTMLVNSKLPTTFWAKAVNTACYVLSRVLLLKPHNKTPYELIRGRPPVIDFMKPFGCSITMLNTRDHLGKFDEKADEGFFVGYSVSSKAIRVFNKRTRIVKKTLNIRFLENTPRNETIGIVGTKDNIVTGHAKKKKEPKQEYILIPICTTNLLISQDPKENEEYTRKNNGVQNPTKEDDKDGQEKDVRDQKEALRRQFELEYARLYGHEEATNINSTNRLNTISTPVNTARPSFTNADPPSPVNTVGTPVNTANEFEEHLFEPFSPLKRAFNLTQVPTVSPMDNTSIFSGAYDDEDVGAEADLNNLETTMNVSTIPITRIHKDHPLESYAGRASLVEATECLDNSRYTLWLVAQGYRQEEGIDYDEVFAPVARIEAISAKTASTPMEAHKSLSKDADGTDVDVHLYRFQIQPKASHMYAVKRIFRYLKGQPNLGLWYPKDSPMDLIAYSDCDYAGAKYIAASHYYGQSKICKRNELLTVDALGTSQETNPILLTLKNLMEDLLPLVVTPEEGRLQGMVKSKLVDFEDVYFVKELKFNLFSVSQMCDKKNSVLFTDTKCFVLSLDFKLTDESHVLLKVPRKDNMYSVDLKNILPKGGLTCHFVKATSDEFKL
ncbi:putative ribonuclease H-like domain-containing protein [Tanacetum coccineum]|uniref:Ribonuclease H-like domain-containing protein n=1 Tax=Tanacetum coccineum TaxID=301880 RepID=A0ABQ5FH71_9ASTR